MANTKKTTDETNKVDTTNDAATLSLGSPEEGEALPEATSPFNAVPKGEVEVTKKAEADEPSDPSGEVQVRRKATARQQKSDQLKEITSFDKLPVAVSVGDIIVSVEEVRGTPILNISLRGWVGDPPLKIRADSVGELEGALKELRKELSA